MGKKIVIEDDPVKYGPKRTERDEDMGKVRASLGVTNNLGDFNSVRVDIAWEDDVQDGEDFDGAVERVFRQVEGKVEGYLAEYDAD